MNALVDTGVLLDYLRGDRRAAAALEACAHRSLSVVTWLEVMAQCPPEVLEPTRAFLRSFERLSISEAVADEALRLALERPGIEMTHALTWATARVNQLSFVTSTPSGPVDATERLVVPYPSATRKAT